MSALSPPRPGLDRAPSVAVVTQRSAGSTAALPEPAPSGGRGREAVAVAAGLLSVVVVVVMELLAIGNHYALRVVSDTPTFAALVRDLARTPMQPDSVFFHTLDTQSMHASPYVQGLAYLWRAVAPAGHLGDPVALGRFVGFVAIGVSLFTLAMLWCFTRSVAGRPAAFAALPAVIATFGPAHVIFSSDLTLGGLLATGYYPTTLAAGLSLVVLMLLRHRSRPATLATVAVLALTLTTDLFSGTVLLIFMIIRCCLAAEQERSEARRVPAIVLGAFALAALWPLFHIFAAFAAAGIPAFGLIGVAFVAPRVWCVLAPVGRRLARSRGLSRLARARACASAELPIAIFGLWACAMLALWTVYLIGHWPRNPALRSYRLGLYWNDEVYRWPLLLLPGGLGVIGLLRLWRRGAGEMALGGAVLFVIGAVGSVVFFATGIQLPLYYRFVLACEVPLAVGLGTFLAGGGRNRRAVAVGWATLLVALAFKVVTLAAVPEVENYFGAPLQSAWALGHVIAPASGRVATDPSTSYYMPAATDNPVITLGGHADSGAEPLRADIGYLLMHRLYAGAPYDSADALLHLWLAGVRWVVVEKSTSLRSANRHLFYFGPYSALIDHSDSALMARYFSRLAMVGTPVYDDEEYTVFHLDGRRVMRAIDEPRSIAPGDVGTVRSALARLVAERGRGAATATASLYEQGVRIVTVSVGAFGSQPHIYAFGESLSTPDAVGVAVSAPGLGCRAICRGDRGLGWVTRLGQVVHADNRFMTVVALPAPRAPVRRHRAPRHHMPKATPRP